MVHSEVRPCPFYLRWIYSYREGNSGSRTALYRTSMHYGEMLIAQKVVVVTSRNRNNCQLHIVWRKTGGASIRGNNRHPLWSIQCGRGENDICIEHAVLLWLLKEPHLQVGRTNRKTVRDYIGTKGVSPTVRQRGEIIDGVNLIPLNRGAHYILRMSGTPVRDRRLLWSPLMYSIDGCGTVTTDSTRTTHNDYGPAKPVLRAPK